jgi:dTDP-4-dehydrorhamnose reductase
MIVVVTGAAGQLGHDVAIRLRNEQHKVFATDLAPFYPKDPDGTMIDQIPYCGMDFSNPATCERVISSVRADAVIHCGSWSDIDSAELPENFPAVWRTNVRGAENIASVCARLGIKLIYVSTDQVYKSSKELVDEKSTLEPVSVYGRARLEAEKAVRELCPNSFIVRTQWLYGLCGDNFIKTMLKAGEDAGRNCIRVADDFIGTPTYTKDLARLIADMLDSSDYGIYNAVNEGGYVSRATYAQEIFRRAGLTNKVIPVHSDKLQSIAKRPMELRLSTDKLAKYHFRKLPPWDSAIGRFLEEIKYPKRIRTRLPLKEQFVDDEDPF